jgi:hypothetical protein
MFFDKVKQENDVSNVTSTFLNGVSGGVCFLGYEDDTVSGRVNLKIIGKNGIESVANNSKVASASPVSNVVALNYQEADVWVVTGVAAATTINVTGLDGIKLKGRSLMMNVTVSDGGSISFGGIDIATAAGEYCAVFANIDGTNIKCISTWKLPTTAS